MNIHVSSVDNYQHKLFFQFADTWNFFIDILENFIKLMKKTWLKKR